MSYKNMYFIVVVALLCCFYHHGDDLLIAQMTKAGSTFYWTTGCNNREDTNVYTHHLKSYIVSCFTARVLSKLCCFAMNTKLNKT
jgi:hypothetical protein